MKRSSSLALVGVLALAATSAFVVAKRGDATVAPAPPKPASVFPSRELEELDRVVQARFAVVPRDGSFGYSRLVPRISAHGPFYPESPPERAAIAKLQETKQQVVFYLVGRPRDPLLRFVADRVQGPLLMTSRIYGPERFYGKQAWGQAQAGDDALAKQAPKEEAFLPVAYAVLNQAKPDDGAQKHVGEWKVVACPIPASSPACVTCHNNMAQAAAKRAKPNGEKPDLVSLHDPLGVALYCVRTASKTPVKQTSAN